MNQLFYILLVVDIFHNKRFRDYLLNFSLLIYTTMSILLFRNVYFRAKSPGWGTLIWNGRGCSSSRLGV